MRILFVTPELPPYSAASSLGEVAASVPKALQGMGHEVTVISPLYGFIDPNERALARRLRKVEVEVGDGPTTFSVYDARTPAGVDLLFLAHEVFFAQTKAVPVGSTEPGALEEGVAFGAFCAAALEVARQASPAFDVVHVHGWQMGLLPLLAREADLTAPVVLGIHQVERQGLFEPALVQRLGLPPHLFTVAGAEFYGRFGFLKAGVVSAAKLITVSPSYATAIRAEGGAGGLEGALSTRASDLVGIAGGVDQGVWNPATDPHLHARFDAMDIGGKQRSKSALQQELGLPVRDDCPLFVLPAPISPEVGVDRLARVTARLMRNDLQLIVQHETGPIDRALVAVLTEHAARWPDRLVVRTEASVSATHRALAAADLVLTAPRLEPGASLQMRAHRYGALPIGPRIGAFADTVVDCDARLETGTGFAYEGETDDALLSTLQRALAAFAQRRAFESIRRRVLRIDHSWDRAAHLYERVYRSLV